MSDIANAPAAHKHSGEDFGSQGQIPSADAIAYIQDNTRAQQRFDQALQEGRLLTQKLAAESYNRYTRGIQDALRELERHVAEAGQNYLAAVSELSGPSELSDRATAAYFDWLRVCAELQAGSPFRAHVERAYQDLTSTLAAAKPNEAPTATSDAYRNFLDALNEGQMLSDEMRARAQQAYTALVDAWKENVVQRQQQLAQAYERYVRDLQESYARSDYEAQMTTVWRDYIASAGEAQQQAKGHYADALVNLTDANRAAVERLRPAT